MLIDRLIDRFSAQRRLADQLTQRVASRSETAVWSRLQDHVFTMDPAQARGYIRARGALIVDSELKSVVSENPTLSDAVVQRVRKQVADVLSFRLQARVAKQNPATLRRAA